jgi:hypothetical protein
MEYLQFFVFDLRVKAGAPWPTRGANTVLDGRRRRGRSRLDDVCSRGAVLVPVVAFG